MAQSAETIGNGITNVAEERRSRGLWLDALLRLLRNRAAVVGFIIIVINFLVAFFASDLAPQSYETQTLTSQNSAPQWVIDTFPSILPKNEEITINPGTELNVAPGERVATGTLLGSSTRRGTTTEYTNLMAGVLFVEGNKLIITQAPVEEFDISSGWELFVEDGDSVLPSDILAQHTASAEQYVARLTNVANNEGCALRDDGTRPRLCVGTVYITETTIFLRNPNFGYVTVDNSYSLGADALGRDLLSRLMYGARISLAVALIGSTVSLLVGIVFGLISGYMSGRVDNIMMRIVDIMYAFPTILLIILLMAFFRTTFVSGNTAVSLVDELDATSTEIALDPNVATEFRGVRIIHIERETLTVLERDYVFEQHLILTVERGADDTVASEHRAGMRVSLERPLTFARLLNRIDNALGGMFFIAIGIGITSWAPMARLTRGQVLSVREREYVEAAHSLGAPTRRVMFAHIFPNILGPIVVAETLTIPSYIAYEAFLSFIGLGVNPPTPSWGAMISEGAEQIREFPFQAIFPALALFFIMFAFNFLGDGLRDALDPRLRGVD